MMKAMRLRSMSSYQESLNDPTPTYEPSPKYEPPAEKFNPNLSLASSPTSPIDHQQIAVSKDDKLTWTKWTIPEGDQITIYRPAPTDHQRYVYTVDPIPNIPTGGRVIISSASPIVIEYPTLTPNSHSPSNEWTSLPSCLKDCALCKDVPRNDGQYPFLPIMPPLPTIFNTLSTDTNPTNTSSVLENPFTPEDRAKPEGKMEGVKGPGFCAQGMLHRSQRLRGKVHAKLEMACEECGWMPLSSSNTNASTSNPSHHRSSSSTNLGSSANTISSTNTKSNAASQIILDASTRSKDPASRELKKSMGGWISDRFIFESHIAPTVREHRTFLGCWVCWEHEGKWVEPMEPDEWWGHMNSHFGEGGDGYRICTGENGWMTKRESCPARRCVRIHS